MGGTQEPEVVQLTREYKKELPSSVWSILTTMKVKEKSVCEMTLETFLKHETNHKILEKIESIKEKS